MHNRKGFMQFCLFCATGLFAVAACCLGLFQFMTQNRAAMALTYKEAGQSYLEKSLRDDMSEEARAYLLSAAQENILHALALNQNDAGAWILGSRIFHAAGDSALSGKAMEVARGIDPAHADSVLALSDISYTRDWRPVFVLSRYETDLTRTVK